MIMKLTCVIENSSMPLGLTSNGAVPFGLLDHKYVYMQLQQHNDSVRDHPKSRQPLTITDNHMPVIDVTVELICFNIKPPMFN